MGNVYIPDDPRLAMFKTDFSLSGFCELSVFGHALAKCPSKLQRLHFNKGLLHLKLG